MQSLKIICPNGHLGFAPIRVDSFNIGVAAGPDYIAADSGSDDIGPGPLGSGTSTSPQDWQRHDLEHMLLAARKLGVPMIIGSSGDTGTNSRVDMYVGIIRELAQKHQLAPFKLGYFYSEVDKAWLKSKMAQGETVEGLDGFANLTESELDATDRIVAMAGQEGRDGRSLEILGHYDPAKKPAVFSLNKTKVQAWVAKGAQMSDTVRSLMKKST